MIKRILITGMSGTGKSAVIKQLIALDYQAIDADCDVYSHWVPVSNEDDTPGMPVEDNRDWVWREDKIEQVLSAYPDRGLFLSGCASNMGKFLPYFDRVVLLSAQDELIMERLAKRKGNTYGKKPEEAARVLALVHEVEPLLRKAADVEMRTDIPLDEVVEKVLQLLDG